jgi:hypothetical protein
MGALLSSAAIAAAQSNSFVTFQVDMSMQVGATFFSTNTVSVHGTFNGWGSGFPLTNNPAGANPYLYSGTLDDTGETNGAVTIFKYVIDPNTYESLPDSQNRVALLPTNSGGSLVLPSVFFDDAGATSEGQVTFQVNMSEEENVGNFIPGAGDTVEVHGSFNSWSGGVTMAPESGNTNIWSVVVPVDASTNAAEEFKYVIQPGTVWEGLPNSSPNVDYDSGNRYFDNFTQTLPAVFFNEVPYSTLPPITNNVTFILDMSVQQELGAFTNSNPDSSVEIHGDFNGWGSGITMTNEANGSNPLLYYTTIQYVGAPDALYNYKFVLQPGTQWENIPGGGNRTFLTGRTNGNFSIGPLYFSFEGPSALDDVVPITNCMVTFTVNMTNAVGIDAVTFDPSVDTVWINGIYNGIDNNYWSWGGLGGPVQFQMTQIGTSELYTATLPINMGQNIDLTYKYGINGNDDEAATGDNHTRYIRGYPNYTMPTDVFGSQGSGTSGEPSFGNLNVTAGPANVSLTWLGRQHVHLESTPSLINPVWTPLLATDATNLPAIPSGVIVGPPGSNYWSYTAKTNFPDSSGNLFYRLVYQ